MRTAIVAVLCIVILSTAAFARIPRSHASVAEFKRYNPCPATGAQRGACPNWEVDHVIPLCAGGPDTPDNMQWLTKSDHRQKTRLDVMHCRLKREGQ